MLVYCPNINFMNLNIFNESRISCVVFSGYQCQLFTKIPIPQCHLSVAKCLWMRLSKLLTNSSGNNNNWQTHSCSLILGAKRHYCVSYSLIPSEELKVNTFWKKDWKEKKGEYSTAEQLMARQQPWCLENKMAAWQHLSGKLFLAR